MSSRFSRSHRSCSSWVSSKRASSSSTLPEPVASSCFWIRAFRVESRISIFIAFSPLNRSLGRPKVKPQSRAAILTALPSATPRDILLNVTRQSIKRQECRNLVLAREQKKSLIDQYGTHASDTGSPEVQIALLSERIGQLTEHFKTHQKDHGSRRGLLMLVSKRRSLLDYLKKYDTERYKTVITKLGIRK